MALTLEALWRNLSVLAKIPRHTYIINPAPQNAYKSSALSNHPLISLFFDFHAAHKCTFRIPNLRGT
jgi:hypothetical protein